MNDWSDEVKARLVREEERLRYKAANLQARGKTVMAAQELVVADDIRAALDHAEDGWARIPAIEAENKRLRQRVEELEREIERLKALGLERQEWRSRMGLSTQDVIVQRAEAAEAKLAEAERIVGLQNAALDVWKGAYPSDDSIHLAALAVAQGDRRLRVALEQIDRETRSASDVGLLRMGSIARAALRGER